MYVDLDNIFPGWVVTILPVTLGLKNILRARQFVTR